MPVGWAPLGPAAWVRFNSDPMKSPTLAEALVAAGKFATVEEAEAFLA